MPASRGYFYSNFNTGTIGNLDSDNYTDIHTFAPSYIFLDTHSRSYNIRHSLLTERGVMIFAFYYKGDKNDYNAFQVFISLPSYKSDKIAGYKIQTIDADYMLENGWLYRYSGSGEDWSWELVDLPILYQNEDNFVTWKVYEDTYLGTWNEFTYIFQVVDKNWNAAFTTNVFGVMYTH